MKQLIRVRCRPRSITASRKRPSNQTGGNSTRLPTLSRAVHGAAAVFLIAIFLCGPAQGAHVFVRQWGTGGAGNGQFTNPEGIAVNPTAGTIYVADSVNNRIENFTSTGVYLGQYGSFGATPGQFNLPIGIAVNGTGFVYIADVGNIRTQVYTSGGSNVSFFASFGDPNWGVATNSSGYVYETLPVSSTTTINLYNPSGTLVSTMGPFGAGVGQFDTPMGIAVNSTGYVYAVDTNHNRTQILDPSGNFVSEWGSNGSANGQFFAPMGIATDPAGNVYVADSGNWRIEEFSPSGAYLDQWGTNGIGPGQFGFVTGVATDDAGNIYTIDTGLNRVQVFSGTAPPPAPVGVAPIIGDNSDNGPPSPPQVSAPTPVPTVLPSPSRTPVVQPTVTAVSLPDLLSQTYPLGFDGLDYNTGGTGTLSLIRSRASAAGADVTMYFDRLEVYQHHSPGVRITFWGDNFTTSHDTITGPVTRAEFVTDPFRATLPPGPVSVSVHAALESLSGPGAITTTVNGTPSPEIAGQYRALAGNDGLRLTALAYTLSVRKDNLSRTAPANITMSIPASWVAANGGKDAVRIGRISDETGTEELLGTAFTGTDPAGNLVFRGDSPNGTSLFGLLTAEATEQEQKAHPNVTYASISQSAMVTNAGMAGWLLGLFESDPALLVVIAAVIAALAYFGWWRRRL